MNLTEVAYRRLFPDKEAQYSFRLKYSGRFSGFNGNIQKANNEITARLSRQWKQVSSDIQIGIIQELLVKLLKVKKHTVEMDLYSNFIRSVHEDIPKTEQEPVLVQAFNRVNKEYFRGTMDIPNLVLSNGTRTLGLYDYGRDQISISKHLLEDEELLDFVMYHEILHKHFKFSSNYGRTRHHTKEFREAEKRFKNAAECEKRINRISRKFSWKFW